MKAASRLHSAGALLPRLLAGLVTLAALGALGALGWVVARRIAYPYDLEWMEGGMLCHALRLLHGQPIYVAPSVDFIPHLYTPLYPLVLAALGKLTGDVGYLAARAVSFTAFVAALLLAGAWAYREGGSRAAALCAMALPAVTFPQTGGFFDLARADSLNLLLTALGAAVAFYGRGRHLLMAVAALLLVAGFFAKQTAAPLIVCVAAAMLVTRRRTVLTFAAVGIASFALGVYLQNRASDGWFWTYIFRLHQGHAFYTRRAYVETPLALARILGPAPLLILLALWRRYHATLGFLAWLALCGALASCLGFGTQWAHVNAYIPGVFFPALARSGARVLLIGRRALVDHVVGEWTIPAGTSNRQGASNRNSWASACIAPPPRAIRMIWWRSRWTCGRIVHSLGRDRSSRLSTWTNPSATLRCGSP
mgnify:CR=1 FL=1